MTAPSYTEDLTDLATGDEATGWVEMTGSIGGNAYSAMGIPAYQDPDYPYIQGQYSVTQDCTKNTSVGSLAYNNGAGTGGHGTDGAYFVWQNFMVASNIGTYAQGGFQIVVGSSTADFNAWYTGGVDKAPYPYGGWINSVVNTTVTPDGTAGTPTATEQYIGSAVYVITGPSKGETHNCDAIRYGRGSAIFEFGDAGNGYATIAGFATQNDNNSNRWGLIQETSGGYLWKGRMALGTVTNAVDFRDSNVSIFIQWTPKVTRNFNLIEIVNASSNVEMTGFQISTLDTSTASPGRFLMTDNATVAITDCTFTDMGTFEFLSNATITNTVFRRCDMITQGGATFDSCTFANHAATTIVGSPGSVDAALYADDLSLITDCTFIGNPTGSPAGSGHAIELGPGAATGSPTSFDFSGNTFTNFGDTGTTDAAIYNNTGTTVIINILSGDSPTYLNGPGSFTIINNAVSILVRGLSEGAAVKMLAAETLGTWTTGDTIFEALANASGEASTSINYESAFGVGGLAVITRCRQQGLPTAAIQDDNGSYTDETSAANSATVADMHLLPTVPVANQDAYLFGHAEQFEQLKLLINTAGTGGFTITWQYWNGAWTNLSGVTDGTSSFSVTGSNKVSWTLPGDWVKTTINSQGPYYYVRALYTAGTVTIVPTATKCTLDVTRYLPFTQNNTITSSGLTVTASWIEDTIATF